MLNSYLTLSDIFKRYWSLNKNVSVFARLLSLSIYNMAGSNDVFFRLLQRLFWKFLTINNQLIATYEPSSLTMGDRLQSYFIYKRITWHTVFTFFKPPLVYNKSQSAIFNGWSWHLHYRAQTFQHSLLS